MNEMAFFFVIAMSMTFTDFVVDVPTRTRTATMLSTFMFFVLSANIVVCLVAIIWTLRIWKKKLPKSEEKQTTDNQVAAG